VYSFFHCLLSLLLCGFLCLPGVTSLSVDLVDNGSDWPDRLDTWLEGVNDRATGDSLPAKLVNRSDCVRLSCHREAVPATVHLSLRHSRSHCEDVHLFGVRVSH